ncbi:MAG: 4Fe-4S binding protein [Candidatus Latescibacteria bacterium]|nr:4Fe-4S binding protein [Candidatus Latescibacterota bacterium]
MLGNIKRIWWQITGVLLFNFPFLERLTFAWLPVPVLNCYSCPLAQGSCPIGTIQHFFVIGAIPLFAVGFVSIFGIIAGRFYCSHLCPFGFLQDLLGRISGRKVRIPRFLDYGKYVVLILFVIILPPIIKEPFFCTLCPAGSLEAGIPIVTKAWYESRFIEAGMFSGMGGILDMIGWWFWFKTGILALVITVAVVIKRPFCRMACPLGALFGLFNRISLFIHPPKVKSAIEKPRYSLKTCPVHITHPGKVDSSSCIKCKECYPLPKKNT